MEGNGSQRAPSTAPSARVSIWESVRACGLWGTEVDKAELRRQVVMPLYLRRAVAAAVAAKDEAAGLAAAEEKAEGEGEGAVVAPVVVFVNSKSGGRHGPVLKVRLHELISEEQVFDLSVVKPSDFVHYGLSCLERLADQGDNCAKATREKMRIVVAGGDGTVGWVLGCLSDLYKMKREPVPPTGIIPLGTGNDLARSFGWGGSFPFGWRSAVKRYLSKAATAPICHLDSWQAVILMPEGEIKELPYALKKVEPSDRLEISQENGTELPEKASCYKGVFYNYLSIGMDAQVAYGFHHLRDAKPYLAQGPVANKLIYAGYSCTQGWFCTPCAAGPQLRGLKNILRLYIKKVNCSEWEQVQMPSSVRSLVVLNLNNYGSGRHPWGDLKPEYLEKRGFFEAHSDDGLLEIFGLKEGWHASFVMAELIKAKHIAQWSMLLNVFLCLFSRIYFQWTMIQIHCLLSGCGYQV
ncbi:diacylglycerol kinase 3-like isoform X2 [Phragmites australis]|uniref:diacylglycerol kinase 3-like isoform X2 n=1 Tax=Phragmites australis TaxID=29695 RepID=UPI002D787199|nr:diacylglycerol kinase 3-like isoform X2 [Phragmites australis]